MPRSDLLRVALAATGLFSLAGTASVASRAEGTTPDPPASILIRGDVQIGRFPVQRDGTLDGAISGVRPSNKPAAWPVRRLHGPMER